MLSNGGEGAILQQVLFKLLNINFKIQCTFLQERMPINAESAVKSQPIN